MNENAMDVPQPKKKKKKKKSKKWYNNRGLIFLALMLFWPLGVYALIKSKKVKTGWKIFLTLLFVGLSVLGVLLLGVFGTAAAITATEAASEAAVEATAEMLELLESYP